MTLSSRFRCPVEQNGKRCRLKVGHPESVPCKFEDEHRDLPPLSKQDDVPPSRMNKTEARYAEILKVVERAGEQFEKVTLRLGPDCRYTPDFFVTRVGVHYLFEFHEVKGAHIREDAMVKLRSAAEQFPHFRFFLAQYKDGNWTIKEIK